MRYAVASLKMGGPLQEEKPLEAESSPSQCAKGTSVLQIRGTEVING